MKKLVILFAFLAAAIAASAENYILYTSTDGKIVNPYKPEVFGAKIISNTYEDGQGKLQFDGELTTIGDMAFIYCSSLESVKIPNSATTIGNYAFYGCSRLESVEIPNSVTTIGDYAFSSCSRLESVEIPNSATTIGDYAFGSCSRLASVKVHWKELQNSYYRTNILGNVNLSNATLYVPDESVEQYKVRSPWKEFGKIVEFDADDEYPDDNFRKQMTFVGGESVRFSLNHKYDNNPAAFTLDLDAIAALLGADNPDEMQMRGIDENGNLSERHTARFGGWWFNAQGTVVDYDESGVDCKFYVEPHADNDWSELFVGHFPNNVNFFDEYEAKLYLTYGDYYYKVVVNISIECKNFIIYTSTDGRIVDPNYNPEAFGAKIISNTYENGQGKILFDGEVTTIGDKAFYDCFSLASVEIPISVTTIGETAFHGCSDLASVEIPNSVTTIGDGAFYECTSLASVEIPNSVTTIGRYAFYYCTGLTSVEIPNSVTTIGSYAFYYCTGLTSVEIPNSVTTIGNEAFGSCSSLTSVEIPNSVTYV